MRKCKAKRKPKQKNGWNKHRWQGVLQAYMMEQGPSSATELIRLQQDRCKSRVQYEYAHAVRARVLVREIRKFPTDDKALFEEALMDLLAWANTFPNAMDWFVLERRQSKPAR